MHFFLGNRKLVKADEESAAEGLEGLAKAVDSGMSAEDIEFSINNTIASISEMRSLSSSDNRRIYLGVGGVLSPYEWSNDDWSAAASVVFDVLGEYYYIIPPNDSDGSSGAWVCTDNINPMLFGAIGDFDCNSESGSDDYLPVLAAISLHSYLKKKMVVTNNHLVSGQISLTGHLDLHIDDSACIFGTGDGVGVVDAINTYNLVTEFSSVGYANFPVLSGYENSTITVDDVSGLSIGDVIFIKDSSLGAYTTTTSPLSEIVTIVSIDGLNLVVDCRLRRQGGYSSGDIYILSKNTKCNIKGHIYGDKTTVRGAVLSIKGYVDPVVNLRCDGNSSRGLLIHSCLRGDYTSRCKSLDDNPSDNRLGYGVIAYGSCKAGSVRSICSDVRHAYTDGVFGSGGIDSGSALDMTVTGVCYSATAASWDTHPDSDGTIFENIKALAGHNDTLQSDKSLLYALQLRSSNTTVNGLTTDLDRCILIKENKNIDSVDKISGVNHKGRLIGGTSSDNRLISVDFAEYLPNENEIDQGGSHSYEFNNCLMFSVEYNDIITTDKYSGCTFDWSQTTLGWPKYTESGGYHEFERCTIYNPINMQVSNDEYKLSLVTVHTDGRSFELLDGGSLTAINSGIEAKGSTVSNSSFCYSSISSGDVSFSYSNVFINDNRDEGTTKPFHDNSTGGTVKTKNLSATRIRGKVSYIGDSDVTLTSGMSDKIQIQSQTLTQDRSVAINTDGASEGDEFQITRTSGGEFLLDVGGLKYLSANKWCSITYNGASWVLVSSGSL